MGYGFRVKSQLKTGRRRGWSQGAGHELQVLAPGTLAAVLQPHNSRGVDGLRLIGLGAYFRAYRVWGVKKV